MAVAMMLAATAAMARGGTTFSNPLVSGADPNVVYNGGEYYFTDTNGGSVAVSAGATPQAAVAAAPVTVSSFGPTVSNVWAPYMWYDSGNGRRCIYYSATVGSTANSAHRMYVLQSNTANPQGGCTDLGQATDPTNDWAMDGSTAVIGGQ